MDCSLPGSSAHRVSPGKNIRVGCHTLLQGIFLTQGPNSGLPHCRWILYHLSHQGTPRILEWVAYPIQSIAIFFSRLLFLFIYFDWRKITLQYCDVFCHTSTWIGHRYTCVHPHLKPHSLPTPIPLGCLRAPVLGVLLHASNLHWSSILHTVMYMFQCYSLKLSHPGLLPLSPKVCSLCLHLLCCHACRIIAFEIL